MRKRPLKNTPIAELLAVLERHRKTLARDPDNRFSVEAIANITAELKARRTA